jgi:hypothetical protein
MYFFFYILDPKSTERFFKLCNKFLFEKFCVLVCYQFVFSSATFNKLSMAIMQGTVFACLNVLNVRIIFVNFTVL